MLASKRTDGLSPKRIYVHAGWGLGAFLKEFVGKNIPWVHFDIAGTAWGAKPSSINPKGSATGVAIRLVIDMLGR